MAPSILRFAALAKGISTSTSGDADTSYCELGCGQGFSANLLAAANPDFRFYATDFNPAQIAGARQLADAAGTKNIHFFDDSFAQFEARTDLPQFDIIALHGIYSWIAAEHRETIVRFIDKRLKPGGLVYISYNCLPGWAAAAPLRQLMYFHAKAASGPTGGKLEPALAFVEKMFAANARGLAAAGLRERFDNLKGQSRNYVAHEYFNDAWELFYHSEVAADLSSARCTFVGSSNLLEHVDAVNLTEPQQAILKETPDPVLRETLRDFMVSQQFRRDIFARGAVALSPGEAMESWLDTRFALIVREGSVSLTVKGALGEANLQEDVYRPVVDAFARQAASGKSAAISLRQLLAENPKVAELGWGRIQQAIIILAGAGYLHPCPVDAKNDGKRRESAKRFNLAVMDKARYTADLQALAAPVIGGGITIGRFQQLLLLALINNEKDPAGFVWRILQAQNQRLAKEGKALETEEDNIAELNRLYSDLQQSLPTLKTLGVI
nr:class I SAM-dependent methyltransferase [Pseudochelatococcus contaminans]